MSKKEAEKFRNINKDECITLGTPPKEIICNEKGKDGKYHLIKGKIIDNTVKMNRKTKQYNELIKSIPFDGTELGFVVANDSQRLQVFSKKLSSNERPNKVIHFWNKKNQFADMDVENLERDDLKKIKESLKKMKKNDKGQFCVNKMFDLNTAYSYDLNADEREQPFCAKEKDTSKIEALKKFFKLK